METKKHSPKKNNINYSNSIYDQFSFESQINNYGSYLGKPILEDYHKEMEYYDDCYKSYKIISHKLLVLTPMNNTSLSKLENSVKKVMDVVKSDLPKSFGFIKNININIQYYNCGSTFLEWGLLFTNKKFEKFIKSHSINEIFDFIVSLKLMDYENYYETIYDIHSLGGNYLFDIDENEKSEEIEYQLKKVLELRIDYGYKLNDVEYYVKVIGIDRYIVESAFKNLSK